MIVATNTGILIQNNIFSKSLTNWEKQQIQPKQM